MKETLNGVNSSNNTKTVLCNVIVTESEFLNAVEIIKKYRQQINSIINENDYILSKNTLIKDAGFNTLVYNCLKHDFDTLEELSKLTSRDILRIRYLGKKSVENIKSVLQKAGLKLRDS